MTGNKGRRDWLTVKESKEGRKAVEEVQSEASA